MLHVSCLMSAVELLTFCEINPRRHGTVVIRHNLDIVHTNKLVLYALHIWMNHQLQPSIAIHTLWKSERNLVFLIFVEWPERKILWLGHGYHTPLNGVDGPASCALVLQVRKDA